MADRADGGVLHVVAVTGSTNADLVAKLTTGEAWPEGHWLIADRQQAGRGRQGRAWHDGAGNLMASSVVRLRPDDPPAPTLALVAGLAVIAAVRRHVPTTSPLQPMLKWPNDVVLSVIASPTASSGALRNHANKTDGVLGPEGSDPDLHGAKLAGVLLERVDKAVVVGVGVNLARAPELADRRTIALAALGPAPDRDSFAADLAAAFITELTQWRTTGLAAVLARWRAAAHPLGTPLTVHEPGGDVLKGDYAGLTPNGSLRLALADGTSRIIHAGDVMLGG